MKILFLTTEDSTFWSHRMALARAAQQAGAEVVIMTRDGSYRARIEQAGFRVVPWKVSRRSLNPFREFYSVLQVVRVYFRERPDLAHHVALKPIVYGGIAARLFPGIRVVHSVTGLGPVFIHSKPRMRALRTLLMAALRWVFGSPHGCVVFQNDEDRRLFTSRRVVAEAKTVVMPGFGVDTETFAPTPEPEGVPIVVLPARMLWEKGIEEFLGAAVKLRERSVSVRMVLAGAPDFNNRGCIDEAQLRRWQRSGVVEWWGHCDDMPSVFAQAQVVCLPSYREGMPKALIEAASCARPVVTTDAPGCSRVVRHGENGLLVPVKDSEALADAIQSLLKDEVRRKEMGEAGRARAVEEFSEDRITRQMLVVYQILLHGIGKASLRPQALNFGSLEKPGARKTIIPQQGNS